MVAGRGRPKSGLEPRFGPFGGVTSRFWRCTHARAKPAKGPNPGSNPDLDLPQPATIVRGVIEHGKSIPGLYLTYFGAFGPEIHRNPSKSRVWSNLGDPLRRWIFSDILQKWLRYRKKTVKTPDFFYIFQRSTSQMYFPPIGLVSGGQDSEKSIGQWPDVTNIDIWGGVSPKLILNKSLKHGPGCR